MNAAVVVWTEGVVVGLLGTNRGRWHFRYPPQWLSSPRRFALSPHLPLKADGFADDADDRRVEWFFDNLLPEGGVREVEARTIQPDDQAFVTKIVELIERHARYLLESTT